MPPAHWESLALPILVLAALFLLYVSSTVIVSKKDTWSLVRSYTYIEDSPLKKRGVDLKRRAMLLSHGQTLNGNMVVGMSSAPVSCVQYDLDIRRVSAPNILDANIG